jgi:nucleoside-diphosphate kinase
VLVYWCASVSRRAAYVQVLVPSEDLAKEHYAEHEGKPFYPGLVKFLASGPVVAMVWQGKEVNAMQLES